jgi:hypothetical protein
MNTDELLGMIVDNTELLESLLSSLLGTEKGDILDAIGMKLLERLEWTSSVI